MARVLLPWWLLLVAASSAQTTPPQTVYAFFELRIDSFTSARGPCAPPSRDCRVFFRACLQHAQQAVDAEPPCMYGSARTDALAAAPGSVRVSAPIRVPIHYKWPGSVSLITELWDAAGPETPGPLFRAVSRLKLPVGPDWLPGGVGDGVAVGDGVLRFSSRVRCNAFYHGDACGVLCRPRNDSFGHYGCDGQGRRRCLEGWRGEYCSQPICARGCMHGVCRAPGECVCRQGWRGERCDECERHPGCQHGTCQQPWQCDCQEGWGGLLCNEDLNYCTNHRPCQNGASCSNTGQGSYTCRCPPGFSGTNCELRSSRCSSAPCRNGGRCTDLPGDYSCSCPPGFRGKSCEESAMTCADGPCFRGGTCREAAGGGYTCLCPPGFTGSNCEKRNVCSSSPCVNGGQCVDLGTRVACRCPPGFSGARCESPVDACASAPCRHGGTCRAGAGGFSCSCALGFGGRDCSQRRSPCDRLPCANGGTCYAHFSGAVCHCPPGFMGASCQFPVAVATPTAAPAAPAASSPALAAAVALAVVTLALLACVTAHLLRQLRRGRRLVAMTTASVKNDLEAVNNNRSAAAGGGGAGGAEKEAFLLPGARLKVSNKDAALADKGGDNAAMFKNKMADCNLTREEQHLEKTSKKCDSLLVPPSLYRPVFILPEQREPCVFATEV